MEFTQAAGHKNWTAARKNRARDRAAAIGAVERKLDGAAGQAVVAATGVVGFYAFAIGAVELVERLIP